MEGGGGGRAYLHNKVRPEGTDTSDADAGFGGAVGCAYACDSFLSVCVCVYVGGYGGSVTAKDHGKGYTSHA